MGDLGAIVPTPAPGNEAHALRLARITYTRMVGRRNKALPEPIDRDDLWGAALLGAAKALARWDPERGVQFASYAIHLIRGEILEEMRRWDWLDRNLRDKAKALYRETGEWPAWARDPRVSLDDPVIRNSESDVEDLSLADTVRDAEIDVERTVTERCDWERLLSRLPEREGYVIRRYIWDGETLLSIAREIGVCETRAKQLRDRALERLAQWAGWEGLE